MGVPSDEVPTETPSSAARPDESREAPDFGPVRTAPSPATRHGEGRDVRAPVPGAPDPMEMIPEDDEEEDKEPGAKKQRLASIEASVKKVIAQLVRAGAPRA